MENFYEAVEEKKVEIIRNMEALEIYKDEFLSAIEIYASMLVEYEYKIALNAELNFMDKNLNNSIAGLRSQMKFYSGALGLDPKSYYGFLRRKPAKKTTKLDLLRRAANA
jgi:hypothetical protein